MKTSTTSFQPPITTILPLVAILSVSAIRSAVEDHARHVEDDKINNQELERVDPEDGDLQVATRLLGPPHCIIRPQQSTKTRNDLIIRWPNYLV